MANAMDKFLKHIPEIDDESGDEYAWSKIIGRIKNKKQEWKEIENLVSVKITNPGKRNKLIQELMDELFRIATDVPYSKKHDKYANKEQLLKDLKKIKADIISVQKSFWHREYHDFLYTHVSKDDWVFEDGENEATEKMEQIKNNLELMQQAAEKATKYYKEKEKLRPNLSTSKKALKNNLAYYIAYKLYEAGIRPTKTREKLFDKVFCLSCDIIELHPNTTGSQHIVRAVDRLKAETSKGSRFKSRFGN